MRDGTKKAIIVVVGGLALAAVLKVGFVLDKAMQRYRIYSNTDISYKNEVYDLKDLVVVTKDNETELCKEIILSDNTRIVHGMGISLGNGIMIIDGEIGHSIPYTAKSGRLVYGFKRVRDVEYGYEAVDDKEMITKEQGEFDVKPLKNHIPYEVAEENGFKISEETLLSILPLDKPIIR